MDELVAVVQELGEKMTRDLRRKAWQWMEERVHRVESLEEARRLLRRRAGIVEVLWCGKAECGHELEGEVKARVLGIPEDVEEKVDGKCVVCGRKAEHVVRAAIAY